MTDMGDNRVDIICTAAFTQTAPVNNFIAVAAAVCSHLVAMYVPQTCAVCTHIKHALGHC